MPGTKEADLVFVLMTDKYRVSRNTRAQWYFKHMNQVITVKPKININDFEDEIEVISMLPSDYQELENEETDLAPHMISTNTQVTFFARRNRQVFILDLSPSMSTVDTQSNRVLYGEIFLSLSRSLRGLSKPFYVPGSKLLFEPEIFVTILAHSPFFTSDAQQVLAKGWKVTSQNVAHFLETIRVRFEEITKIVSELTTICNETKQPQTSENDLRLNTLFDDANKCQIAMTSPDVSMVNMFRYGLLALQLLPQQSNAGLTVITDGMLSLPNATVLEHMLHQLRHHNVACSFLQVGSSPHPQSCFGYVPYIDLMRFITQATFGAYISKCVEPPDDHSYNVYHRAFLAWSFQRGLYGFKADVNWDSQRNNSCWNVSNPYFYSSNDSKGRFATETSVAKDQQPVRNKQIESSVAVSFTRVLSCRLREGYTIKSVNISEANSQIQVTLVLPWKHNVNIEYQLTSQWAPAKHKVPWGDDEELVECRYEVTVEGSYGFVHDVTCQIKKPIKSPFRMAAIRQFWTTLHGLSQSDKQLVHLSNFARNQGIAIPESIRSGNTLFYIAPNSSNLVLAAKTATHQQFAAYWKPICLFDINVWRKWMHTHRINLILNHDLPFPKHLHLPKVGNRYSTIQCRQAMASLSELLKEYSSFVMLENHSYVKMIQSATEPPSSFFMIRVSTQLPCVVLYVAFIGGTPGDLRHQIVSELKDLISECKFPSRTMQKFNKNDKSSDLHQEPLSWSHEKCCVMMRKPIDKIMVRYESLPSDYSMSTDSFSRCPSMYSSSSGMSFANTEPSASSTMFILSKYMYHQRWLFKTNMKSARKLPFMARILSVLTKTRLNQGFSFGHTSCGVINLVKEIDMVSENGHTFPCVIQFVMFPPHVERKDATDSDEGEWQLVTECWIEPQHGTAANVSQTSDYLDKLDYQGIVNAIHLHDSDIISNLLADNDHQDGVTKQSLSLTVASNGQPEPEMQHASPGKVSIATQ
ncbi:KICSTOR complex protein SZT2 [Halotydeus destructor]|nr:KICSTOR complex protein SZT2 [Halotydeus destructor]